MQREFALPTVFVSHDTTEVQALCDDVVLLENGRVVDQGPPTDVLRRRRTREPLPRRIRSGSGSNAPSRKHSVTCRGNSTSDRMASDGRSVLPNPITSAL